MSDPSELVSYPFQIIPSKPEEAAQAPETWLHQRPFSEHDRSFEKEAELFVPGEPLATAMNAAIAVGSPLLLTGDPGTGKTQAAYYAAWKLETKVFHFQVKSESTARELLYHFNTVQYFHDAHLQRGRQGRGASHRGRIAPLDKRRYVERRALWEAFRYGEETGRPAVVLIDEIDKAPRDFPNDLLHELDKMEFTIVETQERITTPHHLRPVVFITSNSERRLPEPFLRRCVYHHIRFDPAVIEAAVGLRRDQFKALSDGLRARAIERFLELHKLPSLRKAPATGELLVWLRVLALALNIPAERVEDKLMAANLSELPYLGVLLKDHRDLEELG